MDSQDKKLHDLFERMPHQQPSPQFRDTLMAKVHAEAARKERRSNIIAWSWLVVTVLLILAIGVAALQMTGTLEMSMRLPQIKFDSETIISIKSASFICAIISLLLYADYALRKRYSSKHNYRP